jgi:lysophospholipase L1-like esterase
MQSSPSKTPRFGEFVLLVVVIPVVVLLLLEGFCRVTGSEHWLEKDKSSLQLEMPTWMELDDTSRLKGVRASADLEALEWLNLFEEGEGFRVRLIPNIQRTVTNTFSKIADDPSRRYVIQTNSAGFRGPEITPDKDPAVFRILIFGDSSSFGWGVNFDQTYGAILQRELEKTFPEKKFELGNFAIPGDSSEYGRLLFDQLGRQYEADLVIFGFGANDAKRVVSRHSTQVEKFSKRLAFHKVEQFFLSSALYRTLKNAAALLSSRSIPAPNVTANVAAVGPKRYRNNLNYLATSTKDQGTRDALILNLCTPKQYSKIARDLATSQNYLYLNGQKLLLDSIPDIQAGKLYPELVSPMKQSYPDELAGNSLYYVSSDGCHPNILGHQIVGVELAKLVVPLMQE